MATELPQELLRRKRDGEALTADALREFAAGIANGRLCDGQIGAFAMAVCLRGMSQQETLDLTLAMRDSGRCIDWRPLALDGPLLDKHSSGGVGDLTSLVLAPMLAACGAYVPMLDVKCGNGATLPSRLLSRALAASLVRVGSQAGLRCSALLTDMEQPLVARIGNALELREAIAYLRGERTPPRLHALCLQLDADSAAAAQARLARAFEITDAAPTLPPLLHARIDAAEASA